MSRLRTASEYNYESELVQDLLLEFGAVPYIRVWRNNVGVAYGVSDVMQLTGTEKKGGGCWSAIRRGLAGIAIIKNLLKDFQTKRAIHFSVPGSADIFGLVTGNKSTGVNRGRFAGIECKIKDKGQEPDQITWQEMFESRGGLYILAYEVMDVYRALEAAGILTADQVKTEIARRR